jgi:hypothetical protein
VAFVDGGGDLRILVCGSGAINDVGHLAQNLRDGTGVKTLGHNYSENGFGRVVLEAFEESLKVGMNLLEARGFEMKVFMLRDVVASFPKMMMLKHLKRDGVRRVSKMGGTLIILRTSVRTLRVISRGFAFASHCCVVVQTRKWGACKQGRMN